MQVKFTQSERPAAGQLVNFSDVSSRSDCSGPGCPMEARLPFPQGSFTPGNVPGPVWSPSPRLEGGTGDYSMRIANCSLLLKPTIMYLLHFAGKGAERRGEVGVFFQDQGLVFGGRVSAAHMLQTSI